MHTFFYFIIFFLILISNSLQAEPAVAVGADFLRSNDCLRILKGKRVGLLTNHTAINSKMESTIHILKSLDAKGEISLTALFAPEHGLSGNAYASEFIKDQEDEDGIPIYSLHGKTERPTDRMLNQIDVLVYDIQDIGTRSYTYVSTLFYAMEAAAKKQIPVVVLDRPNPINGLCVDGPMLEDCWRSLVGYVNVPYCHGMTTGELAKFFNDEYKIGCKLTVIPMKGWMRWMSFSDTGLPWIPTSPHIPEPNSAFYYPTTGILGELSLVNIGIGFTLPFKLIGAPWIDAKKLAKALNDQKFKGVYFEPFHYRPFYGKFAHEDCSGVLILVNDPKTYRPVATQFLIIGILKSLYPDKFNEAVVSLKSKKDRFCRVVGSEEVYRLIISEKNIVWKLRAVDQKERNQFLTLRQKYLIPSYVEE